MILYIIACILFIPLSILNFIVVLIDCGFTWNTYNKYFKNSALAMDIFGNREFRTFWNKTLRKRGGYKFGDERETISSALGKNQRDNTLSKAGKILVFILDKLDKNHCKKSIKNL